MALARFGPNKSNDTIQYEIFCLDETLLQLDAYPEVPNKKRLCFQERYQYW